MILFPAGTFLPNLLPDYECITVPVSPAIPAAALSSSVISACLPSPDSAKRIAAHSNDADYRPLDSYQNVVEWRFLHIVGTLRVTNGPGSGLVRTVDSAES